ncbi:hypothetical protein [Geitlerinema sp. PCC 9228]|uniref:hypothetical protein n=1 Tax=Geitlerinema sp. PCC 9228 TaxID=111611 RepID=UPI00111494BB|nr:hypothetical protein [Geitlerinema sp. PCC 9228]
MDKAIASGIAILNLRGASQVSKPRGCCYWCERRGCIVPYCWWGAFANGRCHGIGTDNRADFLAPGT